MKATLEITLEALTNPSTIAVQHAIALLREELAKPEQEPVAWMLPEYGDVLPASEADGTGLYNIPLYTAPPQREWVGLTDDDVDWILGLAYAHDTELVKTVEAKLKDKNG